MTLQTEYVVDARGHRKSVVLAVSDYLRLMHHLEDLEDSLDLKRAKTTAKKFISFENFIAELKKRKRIR